MSLLTRRLLVTMAAAVMAAMVFLLVQPLVSRDGIAFLVFAQFESTTASFGQEVSWRPDSHQSADKITCSRISIPELPSDARPPSSDGGDVFVRCLFEYSSARVGSANFAFSEHLREQQGWAGRPNALEFSVPATPSFDLGWRKALAWSVLAIGLGGFAFAGQAPRQSNLFGMRVLAATLLAVCVITAIALQQHASVDPGLSIREGSLLFVLVATLAIPSIEELFFRGWMLDALRTCWSTVTSVAISSALFSAAHLLSGTSPLAALAVAVVFCVVRLKSKTILMPMALHSLVNLAAISHALASQ